SQHRTAIVFIQTSRKERYFSSFGIPVREDLLSIGADAPHWGLPLPANRTVSSPSGSRPGGEPLEDLQIVHGSLLLFLKEIKNGFFPLLDCANGKLNILNGCYWSSPGKFNTTLTYS